MDDLFQFAYTDDSYLYAYKRLSCTIKDKPTDFIVHEINENMEVADDCNQTIPDLPIIETINVSKETQTETLKDTNDVFYEMDESMRKRIEEYIDKCRAYHYQEELNVSIPDNRKLYPEVLQSLSENPHISLQSQYGSLHIKHNLLFDELVDVIGTDDASELLSFILRSKMNKQQLPQYTFKTKPIEDKDKRRSIHLFCKQHYPFVRTSTEGNCILLTIRGNKKRKNQNSKQEDKKPRLSTILQFTLKKTNVELLSLKTRLCQLFHCNERAISFAGIKDKKAVTYQFGTVRDVSPEMLIEASRELPNITLGHFCYVERELRVGELWGNAFTIILHEVQSTRECIEEAVSHMREKGFVNYFGTQRLGTTWTEELATVVVGKYLMCGDWKKAIQLLLRPGYMFTDERSEQALKQYEIDHDSKAAARLVPLTVYNLISLLRGIHRYGCDSLLVTETPLTEKQKGLLNSVLKELPKEMVSFYIKAFQSFLFNKIVQWRIQKYKDSIMKGDLVLKGGEVSILTEEDCTTQKYSLNDVILPLCGLDVQMPDNEVGIEYRKLFKKYAGVELSEMNHEKNSFILPGSYRVLSSKPIDLQSVYNEETMEWKLSFRLKKGIYATTMINEMTNGGCIQKWICLLSLLPVLLFEIEKK